ncbi:MAG: tRNA (uridine(34)/cytosine(34)/5-carboxymethylaminomethyluridine(34)-2'-O)-methyltransferase TrmL [Leptolyngbya foveolarum]|uniref:Putative tRNA (cytidine(34)-2'-O)-methyltransferase n=1 Tax=Leptolyngbya foveolarum TaxID=47253 RepID=A0A2W4WC69_9CYAN|nr:MAG: tRNA (uridine(34)/cytosine(34)/5-carboxymethylaminomethyluridine(34)-2'-O)-methyltransferase TrmL [Leptolyngbya foveolarum]
MNRVVLVTPEIPPNTGNIARTCAATGAPLHLIEPLGFELSDRYLKRAGLDYWPYVDLHVHASVEDFWQYAKAEGGRLIGFSARATRSYTELKYQSDDWLLFGCESQGLPPEVIAQCEQTLTIPMSKSHVRSLNLSVSAAVGLFEALRQTQQLG